MLSLYLPGCIYLNFFTKHRQSYLQLSNFRSYGLLDAVGHCSSSIPSMWDELRRNQCSSFSHSRQPQLRGWGGGGRKRKGERRGRERGERERKREKEEEENGDRRKKGRKVGGRKEGKEGRERGRKEGEGGGGERCKVRTNKHFRC